MKTATPNHPQLSLPFDSESQAESSSQMRRDEYKEATSQVNVPSSIGHASPAVVVDFQTALSKRQTASQTAEAGLYRRILDTVRHIG